MIIKSVKENYPDLKQQVVAIDNMFILFNICVFVLLINVLSGFSIARFVADSAAIIVMGCSVSRW